MLIVKNHVPQQNNGKQGLDPALEKIEKLPKELGSVDKIATDNDYKSKANTILAAKKALNSMLLWAENSIMINLVIYYQRNQKCQITQHHQGSCHR